jgi:hypothetical protein
MEVPCPVLLDGPWSPVGYQVVEVAEKTVSAPEPGPRSGRCEEKPAPWSAAGYKVVEVKERPSPAARAPQRAPRRKRHPLVRWGAVAAGSTLLLVVGVGLVMGRQTPPVPAPPPVPVVSPAPVCAVPNQCKVEQGTFGTTVQFVRNPAEAGRLAAKEHKLMLVLHVSGNFEEARFT